MSLFAAPSLPCDAPASLCLSPELAPLAGSGLVRQSHRFTFSRQKRISVYGKRIMARVLESIRPGDTAFRECYQFTIAELAQGTGLSQATMRSAAEDAVRELAHVCWEFRNEENTEWYTLHLLDTTRRQRCGVKDGVVTVILNPELAPMFLNVSGWYNEYALTDYLRINSWYTMRLYEILSCYRDSGWWETTLDQYRALLDCGVELDKRNNPKRDKQGQPIVKLARTKDLIAYTVLHAQRELQGTPLEFSFEQLKATHKGAGRPKVVGLRFHLKHVTPKDIPAKWLENDRLARLIDGLRRFRVSDRNIARYLEAMGSQAAQQLLTQWQLKQNSNARIDDLTKYCNSVFVRQGKLALERRAAQSTQDQQARLEAQQIVLDLGLRERLDPELEAVAQRAAGQSKKRGK